MFLAPHHGQEGGFSKYREPHTFDLDEAKTIINDNVEEFIKRISETKKISLATFTPWKNSNVLSRTASTLGETFKGDDVMIPQIQILSH